MPRGLLPAGLQLLLGVQGQDGLDRGQEEVRVPGGGPAVPRPQARGGAAGQARQVSHGHGHGHSQDGHGHGQHGQDGQVSHGLGQAHWLLVQQKGNSSIEWCQQT